MGTDQCFLDSIDTCTHVLVCFPYRLRRVLSDSKEEVEGLVKNYKSPAKLASFVVAMKRLILYIIAFGFTYQDVKSESKKGVLMLSLCPTPPDMLQDGSSQLGDRHCVI